MRFPLSGSLSARPARPRRGVAFALALVTLAVLFAITMVVTRYGFLSRRLLERREHQYQTLSLAESGLELAAARLLLSPADYKGESVEIIPRSQVRIEVHRTGQTGDVFQLTAEARFPTDIPHPSMRTLTRLYRRIANGDRVRLEASAADLP